MLISILWPLAKRETYGIPFGIRYLNDGALPNS